MSTNALDRIGAPRATTVSQATAVEQSRAVAEVAAAVEVAQRFPRDLATVRAEVEQACASMSLARKAFYSVPQRGEGNTVHLARELARIYGNFQSGVHELRRDDAAGESEVQAFAWDVQTNNRATRTFVSPHAKMAQGKRKVISDLDDIYRNNQNTGAKAVRECIFASLPPWLVELAETTCRATLERGDGKSIEQRSADAVGAFIRLHVSEEQLVERVGRERSRWDAQDIASLEVVFRSIQSGESSTDEQFATRRVTVADITEPATEEQS